MLLGVVTGVIASLFLVIPVSLLLGDDDTSTSNSQGTSSATETAQEETVVAGGGQGQGNGQGNGGNGQGNGQGQGQGNGQGNGGNGQGQGQGNGAGGGNSIVENADPLSYGLASPEVLATFEKGGCVACHSIKGVGGGAATLGPHLYRLGEIAVDRRPGVSVEAYIEESILDPTAFTMPNCPTGPCIEGLMPTTYGESLSAEDISILVTYLAALGTPAEADVLTQP